MVWKAFITGKIIYFINQIDLQNYYAVFPCSPNSFCMTHGYLAQDFKVKSLRRLKTKNLNGEIFWCTSNHSSPLDNTVIEMLELQKREAGRQFLVNRSLTVQQTHTYTKASVGLLSVLLYKAVALGKQEQDETTLHNLIAGFYGCCQSKGIFFSFVFERFHMEMDAL